MAATGKSKTAPRKRVRGIREGEWTDLLLQLQKAGGSWAEATRNVYDTLYAARIVAGDLFCEREESPPLELVFEVYDRLMEERRELERESPE